MTTFFVDRAERHHHSARRCDLRCRGRAAPPLRPGAFTLSRGHLGGDPDIAGGAGRHDVLRHPVIGDDVVIHANASIISRVTIGAGSCIGGNVWFRQNVPPGSLMEIRLPSILPIT